ncbi:BatA domain-containing protein [Aquisphaera insulae]|uniref:BatA domain-containing protein n=1 Tax=Aquisphaera insulae TaxID=2712864 RepID=UPI0013EBA4DE|nr:BatA domain-containing protein [Aquisphaera insulae]
MEFSLINAGLAAGAALAALPVILHLFMRQTPKHVIFPALRLVRERQKRSKKRMRIKNWLLLLARMAVLALMALALARPTLNSQVSLGDESVPTALGLVFDTSLSMGYKENDKTRLDEAKERALAILDKVPDSSLIFPVNSAEPGVPVGLSPAAARKWIDNLAIRPVNRTLNAAVGRTYPVVAECDRPRREVFVFTDLTRSAWNPGEHAAGLDQAAKILKEGHGGKISTFIIRLGPKELQDVAIDAAEPASQVATQGEEMEVRVRVRNSGSQPASRVVEFYLDGVKKGAKPIEIPPGQQPEVTFLTPPRLQDAELHRGEVRLTGAPDPLDFNDRRYFTFRVRPALKVLLIAEAAIDADFVAAALDPDPVPGSPRTVQLSRARPGELVSRFRDTLKDQAAVFLLNVPALDEEAWGLLNAYVHQGGGLVVGLGNRCQAANYNGATAAQVLAAGLDTVQSPRKEAMFGSIADFTHPLFQGYAKDMEPLLAITPVYRYWSLKPAKEARVLLNLSDNAPALLERTFKGARPGRSLLWSTPLSRRADRRDPAAWNEFPLPDSGWPFLVLMNRTVPYLAGTSSEQFTYEAGENVLLTLPQGTRYNNFTLTGPDAKSPESIPPPTSGEVLEIIAPQAIGQWSVTAKDADNKPSKLGFSLNPPRAESQFNPLETADLDAIFGKDGYVLAQDDKALRDAVDTARVGRELFPWLMMLILIIVTLETVLANTFYKEAQRPDTAAAPA